MKKYIFLLSVVFFLLGCSEEAVVKQPNIIIFLVDDMGLMDTSVPMLVDKNGNPKRYPLNDWYQTPNMERLVAQGIRFSDFYSHNVCSPTRISIMTGQNAARHLTTDYINPWQNNREINNKRFPLEICQRVPPEWNWQGLKKNTFTLPKLLKQEGYSTIHIGKAHFAPFHHEGENPQNLGFDVNVAGSAIGAPGSYYGEADYGRQSKNPLARPVQGLDKYHGTETYLTEALTLEAKAELGKALVADKPFFLNMCHYAVHSPFHSDPRFADNYNNSSVNKASQAYATMIEGMDKSLGDLMDYIETTGEAENTLFIFLSDNGGDAPLAGTDDISSSAPFRGRKGSKWEGGVRVPFIAAWGKRNSDKPWQKKLPIPAGEICDEIGVCNDLLPTIAELLNISIPNNYQVDGQSLLELLAGKSDAKRKNEFLNHYPHPRRGESHFFTTWRNGDWKVRYEYFADNDKRFGLYNLSTDPSESNNLAIEYSEKLQSMMRGMVKELESMNAVYPVQDGQTIQPIIP